MTNNKVAVTADIHLRKGDNYKEREATLLKILDVLVSDKITTLIIAGDLFDKGYNNYKELESVVSRKEYKHINFYVIPGNHDYQLKAKFFTAENIKIIEEPEVISFHENSPFLFVPYKENSTMGSQIAKAYQQISDKEWVLVGHGDYIEGQRTINPYEKGVYMPLTISDVKRFNPSLILMGHIHKPTQSKNLYYPGSPFPLHRNETGLRRFLTINTKTKEVEERTIDSDTIFYNKTLFIIPSLSKEERVKELHLILSSLNINKEDLKKVVLELKMEGCLSGDKRELKALTEEYLKDKIKKVNTDMEELAVTEEDSERWEIFKKTNQLLEKQSKKDNPIKREVIKQILEIIYK